MITQADVLKLQYSDTGRPWCKLATASLNTNKLNYSSVGRPWIGHSGGTITTVIQIGNIKRVSKVNWGEIKTISEVEGW